MKQTLASLLVAFALMAGGCSTSADDTSSTLPTAPSTPLVTDNFSGTVQVGSNDLHTFTVTSGGFPITINLTRPARRRRLRWGWASASGMERTARM